MSSLSLKVLTNFIKLLLHSPAWLVELSLSILDLVVFVIIIYIWEKCMWKFPFCIDFPSNRRPADFCSHGSTCEPLHKANDLNWTCKSVYIVQLSHKMSGNLGENKWITPHVALTWNRAISTHSRLPHDQHYVMMPKIADFYTNVNKSLCLTIMS